MSCDPLGGHHWQGSWSSTEAHVRYPLRPVWRRAHRDDPCGRPRRDSSMWMLSSDPVASDDVQKMQPYAKQKKAVLEGGTADPSPASSPQIVIAEPGWAVWHVDGTTTLSCKDSLVASAVALASLRVHVIKPRPSPSSEGNGDAVLVMLIPSVTKGHTSHSAVDGDKCGVLVCTPPDDKGCPRWKPMPLRPLASGPPFHPCLPHHHFFFGTRSRRS